MKKLFIAITFVLTLSATLLIVALIILDDGMRPPKLPTKSSANTLTITSNGCCFWAEDVVVSILKDNGQKTEIATHETVHMYNIFKHSFPETLTSDLSLHIEFRCIYGDVVDFSMSVMDFDSTNDLLQSGVLIYFQEHDDMYLNIISGGNRKSYKMGQTENRWVLMDTPNRVPSY